MTRISECDRTDFFSLTLIRTLPKSHEMYSLWFGIDSIYQKKAVADFF